MKATLLKNYEKITLMKKSKHYHQQQEILLNKCNSVTSKKIRTYEEL